MVPPIKARCGLPGIGRRRSEGFYGTVIDSPFNAGVWIGRRRACVACSKLYPSDSNFCSLNAVPKNEIPTGKRSPVNPAGTIKSGNPVRFAIFVADDAG